jgi:hypothetical protein
MIDPATARAQFVQPALDQLGLYSLDAEKLLMGTAAVESNFANFIQFGGGPARGMFQMEPPTFEDLVGRVLGHHAALNTAIKGMAEALPLSFLELTSNHLFAAGMARVKYFSIPAPIPSSLAEQAHYWRHYYNGESVHGLQEADYIASWNRYCAALYEPVTA